MRRLVAGAVLAIIIVLAVFFLSQTTTVPTTRDSCVSDSDCTAAQCCHPTSAVNKAFAPDCSDTLCTMNCEPNTLDCGQGEIKCVNSKCAVVLK